MKIFKNGVGRPSNEIIKKRRILKISAICIAIIIVFISSYIISNHNSFDKGQLQNRININVNKNARNSKYKQLYNLTASSMSEVMKINFDVTSNDKGSNDLQSFAKVTTTDKKKYYVFAQIKNDTNALLSVYDLNKSSNRWYKKKVATLCHANGMTFNNKTNQVIIARGCTSGGRTGRWARAFNIKTSPNPSSNNFQWIDTNYEDSKAITYITNSNRYIYGSGTYFKTISKTIPRLTKRLCTENYSKTHKCDNQDISYYNDIIFQIRNIKTGNEGSRVVYANYIDLYNLTTGEYLGSIKVNKGSLYELESVILSNNKLELLFNHIRHKGGFLYRTKEEVRFSF